MIALIFSFVLSDASTDENTLLIVNKMEEEGFDSSPRELEAAEIYLGELNPMLEEMIDQRFLIDTEILLTSLEKGIVFTGFKRSIIMLATTLNRWKVTSIFDETPIITLAFEVRPTFYKQ